MNTVIATKTVDGIVNLTSDGSIAHAPKDISSRPRVKMTKGQVFGVDEAAVAEANEVRAVRGEPQDVVVFPHPEPIARHFAEMGVLVEGDTLPREGSPVTIGDIKGDAKTEAQSTVEVGGAVGNQMAKGKAPAAKDTSGIDDL